MHFNYSADHNLSFFQKKISAIRYAHFKADPESDPPWPNNIVQVLKVDSDGNAWFFTSCRKEHAIVSGKSFFACLDFYRKGADCKLQLTGNVSMAEDEELLASENPAKHSSSNLLLMKMKILKAGYSDHGFHPVIVFRERLKIILRQVFLLHAMQDKIASNIH